jgi:hypothetical protein
MSAKKTHAPAHCYQICQDVFLYLAAWLQQKNPGAEQSLAKSQIKF